MSFARTLAIVGLGGFAAAAALSFSDAAAQQIFRSVSPDGRVTFSDTPPVGPAAGGKVVALVPSTAAANADLGSLPFELRQVASRFPVTLYAGPECAPCAAGRGMLSARGIPFTEKTVSTAEDIEALRRLASVATLPVLAIGSEQLKGYSEIEWGQFLDAAGYPKTSQLPAGYQSPAATPLVEAQEPKPAPARRPPRPAPATAETVPETPPYNGGIRF